MNPKDVQLHAGDGGTPHTPSKLSIYEHFKIFRDYIEHEDALINNRLMWNITFQGFLIAAYAFSVQKLADIYPKPRTQEITETALFWLILALPVFGGAISFLSYQGVKAAQRAIDNLEQQWKEILKLEYSTENHGLLPNLIGGGSTKATSFHEETHLAEPKIHHVVAELGLSAPLAFPRIFELMWGTLFLTHVIPWVPYFCSKVLGP